SSLRSSERPLGTPTLTSANAWSPTQRTLAMWTPRISGLRRTELATRSIRFGSTRSVSELIARIARRAASVSIITPTTQAAEASHREAPGARVWNDVRLQESGGGLLQNAKRGHRQ